MQGEGGPQARSVDFVHVFLLPRVTGEEEDMDGLSYLSFITVWKDLEITCQRPSALSRVR